MIRTALVVGIAAAVLTACGSTPCSTACAEFRPTDVVVTEKDRAVTVHFGQKIQLVLHARSGMSNWGNVTVDDQTVLRPIPSGITPTRGVTIAIFAAVATGSARITATAGPLCSPNQACPQYAVLFEVNVTVT